MNTMVIGNNVRNLRKQRKLTQEELAELAGVSRNYISMIERDEAENISSDIIQKIAWGLGVKVSQITGQPNSETGTIVPPGLREFALNAELSYDVVDSLLKIPFRGKEPITASEWKELYEAIKSFI